MSGTLPAGSRWARRGAFPRVRGFAAGASDAATASLRSSVITYAAALLLSCAVPAQQRDAPLLRFLSLRPTPAPAPNAAPPGGELPLLRFIELKAHNASLAGPGEQCRVAVLAFRLESGQARDEWLAVELADSLGRKLDSFGGLAFLDAGEVRSHERRRAKREEALDDRETARLARRIGADIVVSGTVRRSGDAVSVALEARRPSTAAPPGRFRVEGLLGRLCELEARMAARLAALLGVPPSDAEMERLAACPTSSPAAFEELARARQSPDGSHARIQHLQKAVEADPGCVEARLMLGDAYYGIGATYRYVEWFNMALAEYRKAVALSPGCGEAYRGMGLVYMMNGRYDLARRALEKAVETDPDPRAARSALTRLEGMGR